ncbi:MAG: hypothetical protein D3910_27190, partial [Candidatus Electrothrix sp. ATG2]|nr:hypothetical protein [Candidatus Electrothrix sp. ATG2]
MKASGFTRVTRTIFILCCSGPLDQKGCLPEIQMDYMQEILRLIPSVDACLLAVQQDPELETFPLMLLKKAIRSVLEKQRQRVLEGNEVIADDLEISALLPSIKETIREFHRPAFRRVINGTGVIIHTNLG